MQGGLSHAGMSLQSKLHLISSWLSPRLELHCLIWSVDILMSFFVLSAINEA